MQPSFVDPPSSFLPRLRAETQTAHHAIERVPALAVLMAPAITPGDLVSVLQHMHAFHSALHDPLALALAPIPSAMAYRDATRLDALIEDLAFFGHRPDPSLAMAAPPELDSAGKALGYLYVIEGSGLGGRVIARRLEDHLGLTAARGASFFAGRTAAELRTRFQRLVAILEHEAAFSPAAAHAMIAGANDAFQRFAAWMSGAPRDRAAARAA